MPYCPPQVLPCGARTDLVMPSGTFHPGFPSTGRLPGRAPAATAGHVDTGLSSAGAEARAAEPAASRQSGQEYAWRYEFAIDSNSDPTLRAG